MDAQQLVRVVTLVGGLLALCGVGGLIWLGAMELRLRAQRRVRLQPGLAAAGGGLVRTEPRLPLGKQMLGAVRKLGHQSAAQDPEKLSVLRSRLMQAGYYNREAPIIFLGVKAVAMVAATVGVLLTLPMLAGGKGGFTGILLAAVLTGVALMGPDKVISARRQSREREYAEGFPDLLDLLVASVEAGLGLDAAVTRVTEELARRYPNLTVHLRFLVLELRAGRARKDAWAAFADRLGTEDARALATMLRQSEEMGTSLGETLSVFSQDMREKRMLRAEEKALALSAKLTLPLIVFIFPCLMGSLMLPAVVRLMQAFKH